MPDPTVFYVYILRDPRPDKNGQPIYVGKGKGRRARVHWGKTDHENPLLQRVFDKIRKADLKPHIEIARRFVTEADAFQFEIELIAKYGRRNLNLGTLCNMSDGGEGNAGCLGASEHMRKLNADPEFKKANAERIRKFVASPAGKEAAKANSERLRERHKDPVYAERHSERMRELNTNPKIKEANAERMNNRQSDPVFIKARYDGIQKLHADPIFAEAHSERGREAMLKLKASPGYEDKRRAGIRAYHVKRRAALTASTDI